MEKTYVDIIDTKRSPVAAVTIGAEGALNKSAFSGLSPQDLGAQVLRALLSKSGVRIEDIDAFFLASAISQKVDLNGYYALPDFLLRHAFPKTNIHAVSRLIEKACSGGIFAPWCAVTEILTGNADFAIGGGLDKMDDCPNSFIAEGLTDFETGKLMVELADEKARDLGEGFTQKEHDEYALQSYEFARDHVEDHRVVPIFDTQGNLLLGHDDGADGFEKRMKSLRTSLTNPKYAEKMLYPGCKIMSLTNSSGLGSGTAFCLFGNSKVVKARGISPIARVITCAEWSEKIPKDFIVAPYGAVQKAFAFAGLTASDISRWENNPAFSTAPLALMKNFDIPRARMNSWSDSIVLRHPIAGTGTILITKLVQILQKNKERFGIVIICNAVAEATAMIIEVFPQQ